jgi:hypothetical protein
MTEQLENLLKNLFFYFKFSTGSVEILFFFIFDGLLMMMLSFTIGISV